jgi:hypothetical protein
MAKAPVLTPKAVKTPEERKMEPPVMPSSGSGEGGAGGHSRNKNLRDNLLALSSNLPAPPTTFDVTKYYRIRLTQAVSVHGDAPDVHMLRPSSDNVVSGELAQSIREFISGAEEVS